MTRFTLTSNVKVNIDSKFLKFYITKMNCLLDGQIRFFTDLEFLKLSMSEESEELTRDDLVFRKTGFNQLRNSIYWLQRYMAQMGLPAHEIRKRMLKMGENMGATFSKHLDLPTSETKQYFEKLYITIVHSKVSVVQQGNTFHITDSKCPNCKYSYPDIEVAGCNMTVGMMAEILERNGLKLVDKKVLRSRTYGDSECVHSYTLEEGE